MRFALPRALSRFAEEPGQSLIELALVLPVFLLLVFGFISFVMVIYGLSNATYASRLLIRYACVHSSTSYKPISSSDVTAIVAPYMNNFPSNTYTITPSWSTGSPTLGGNATVSIAITYHITLPGFTLSPLTVQTSASGSVVQ